MYDYRPYGKQQTGPAMAGPGYTGHVEDPETGLVYMQARYYDREVGRFLSVDPDAGAFNRFAYTNSNPVMLTDPTGRNPDCSTDCLKMRALSNKMSSHGGVSAQGGFDESSTLIDPKIGRAATIAANKALGASPVKQAVDFDGLAKIWARIVIPIALHFNTEIMSKFFDVGGQYAWGPAYSSGNICSTSCFVSFDGTPNLSGGLLVGYIHTHPRNVGFSGGDLYTAYRAYTQLQSLAPIHAYVALPNNQVQEWNTDSYLHQPYNDLWQEYSVYSRVVK